MAALRAFVADPKFDALRERARDELRSVLRELPAKVRSRLQRSDQVAKGDVYFIAFDATAEDHLSLARIFLDRAGAQLSATQRAYLARMNATPVALYEVVEVRRDEGLELRDVFGGAPLFVAERKATHSLRRGEGMAARIIRGGNDAPAIEPPYYRYTPAAMRELGEAITDGRRDLMRRRSPQVVAARPALEREFVARLAYQYWARQSLDDIKPVRITAIRRTAATKRLWNSVYDELDALLAARASWNGGMNLSMLDGFLTAIASSPRAVGERHWLPLVLGAAQPTLVTVPRDDERLTVLARSHLAHVAQRLTSDEFKAIVSRTVVPPLTSVASFWCVGYLRGILLRRAAWQSLCERHPGIDSTVLPIVTLAIPADCTKLLPLPKKLRQESERTLPLAVHLLYRVIVEHPRLRRHIDVLHGSAQTGALARVLDALGP